VCRDHIALTAIIAETTTGNVINNSAVARFILSAPRPRLNDLATGFMTGGDSLISLWPFTEVFMINTTDIRPTDGGGFNFDEHFSVTRFWYRNFSEDGSTITRKGGCLHGMLIH